MGNLMTVFTNKLCEIDPLIVFHEVHWSKIISSVCAIKMKYFRDHNINLNNPMLRSGN